MSENTTQKKERDIWNAQSLKSFVKAKTDWFNGEDYDSRLHLSFVEHTGKPKFDPVKAIEIGVPMVKAGSDGDKRTGITALGLCQMICNGVFAKMCANERQAFEQRKANANGNKVYQQAIWGCIGGTTASRSKDGKSEFRKIEIIPGQKDGTYAFRAMSCEGETNETLGGVQPKKGAQWTQIIVPVDAEYLYAFAVNTIAAWNAHQSARILSHMSILPAAQKNETPAAEKVQSTPAPTPVLPQTPAQAPAPNVPAKPSCVWAFYDQKFYGPMGCATNPNAAVTCATRCLNKLKKERNLHWDENACNKMHNEILNGKPGGENALQNMWLTPLPLFLAENPENGGQGDDILFVMVFRSVF